MCTACYALSVAGPEGLGSSAAAEFLQQTSACSSTEEHHAALIRISVALTCVRSLDVHRRSTVPYEDDWDDEALWDDDALQMLYDEPGMYSAYEQQRGPRRCVQHWQLAALLGWHALRPVPNVVQQYARHSWRQRM